LIDWFLVFNTTFSNISAISWRPVVVVEEAGENHRPWASNWQTLSLTKECPLQFTVKRNIDYNSQWNKFCWSQKNIWFNFHSYHITLCITDALVMRKLGLLFQHCVTWKCENCCLPDNSFHFILSISFFSCVIVHLVVCRYTHDHFFLSFGTF
jgi:hypothetical protein